MTIHNITLREANQNFAQYIKAVEMGDEIIITRHGKPVARITNIPMKKQLSEEQIDARKRILKLMHQGLSLKGKTVKREDLHER